MSEYKISGYHNSHFNIECHEKSLKITIHRGYISIWFNDNIFDDCENHVYEQIIYMNTDYLELISLLRDIKLQLELHSIKYKFMLVQFIKDIFRTFGLYENIHKFYTDDDGCDSIIFYPSCFSNGSFRAKSNTDTKIVYSLQKSICRTRLKVGVEVLNNAWSKVSESSFTYYSSQPIGRLNIDNILKLLELKTHYQEKYLLTLSEK